MGLGMHRGRSQAARLVVGWGILALACGSSAPVAGASATTSSQLSPTSPSAPPPSTSSLPDIEPGRYKVIAPITRAEASQAGLIGLNIDENIGTFTLTLAADGELRVDQKGSPKAEFPRLTGAYEGAGSRIELRIYYPFTGVWTLDFETKGAMLTFHVVEVSKEIHRIGVKVIFETHPWRRIG